MNISSFTFKNQAEKYINELNKVFNEEIFNLIETLGKELLKAWENNQNVYICGNGGSGANAIHMANDFIYGIGACGEGAKIPGLKVEALTANTGVITCLANDNGYENIFSYQLKVKGNPNDLLIALSGSGNSPNIVNALEAAKDIGMKSFAIIAYSGGKCLNLADIPIHFKIDDMQIAEDTQLIIGHICMQWLTQNKPSKIDKSNTVKKYESPNIKH